MKSLIKKIQVQDFSGGPVLKNPPSNAGVASLIPHWVTKISHASGQLEKKPTNHKWRAHASQQRPSAAPPPKKQQHTHTSITCCCQNDICNSKSSANGMEAVQN